VRCSGLRYGIPLSGEKKGVAQSEDCFGHKRGMKKKVGLFDKYTSNQNRGEVVLCRPMEGGKKSRAGVVITRTNVSWTLWWNPPAEGRGAFGSKVDAAEVSLKKGAETKRG